MAFVNTFGFSKGGFMVIKKSTLAPFKQKKNVFFGDSWRISSKRHCRKKYKTRVSGLCDDHYFHIPHESLKKTIFFVFINYSTSFLFYLSNKVVIKSKIYLIIVFVHQYTCYKFKSYSIIIFSCSAWYFRAACDFSKVAVSSDQLINGF